MNVRWSSARDCPRKAVLETREPPDRERTDREQRLGFRGKRLQRDYTDLLAIEHCASCHVTYDAIGTTFNHEGCPLDREKKVRWPKPPATPVGVLHTDIFLRPTRTPIEVKSSTAVTDERIDHWLLQLPGQIFYDTDADELGLLVILDPATYQEERLPLTLTDTWRKRVEDVTGQIVRAQAGGPLPPRVCRRPSDAGKHFCRHAETCFQGWEASTIPALDDLQVASLARTLYDTKLEERQIAAELDMVKQRRTRVQDDLADLLDPGTYDVDGLKLTRSPRARETLSRKRLELHGVPDHVLAEATKRSEYEVWTVTRVDVSDHDTDDEGPPF